MGEVFDLFDFWDGRDGLVDAGKIGDFLRCCGLNPTNEVVLKNGGVANMGEKQYKFEEILPIFQAVAKEPEVEDILSFTETHEDFEGNIKYEDFINKVMAGPIDAKDRRKNRQFPTLRP